MNTRLIRFMVKPFVSPKSQQGSMYTTVMVVALVGIVAIAGLKAIPAYMDNGVVVGTIEAMDERNELEKMNVREIRAALQRTLITNGIRDFDPLNIQLISEDGERYVTINYEVRSPLFMNIDLVVVFDDRFDL